MCQPCTQFALPTVDLNDTETARILAKALRALFTRTELFRSAFDLAERQSEILAHMMVMCLCDDAPLCSDGSVVLELLPDCDHKAGCCRRFTFSQFQNAYLTVTRTATNELLVDDYHIPVVS